MTQFPLIVEIWRYFGNDKSLVQTNKFETFIEVYRFKENWNKSRNHPQNQFASGPYYE